MYKIAFLNDDTEYSKDFFRWNIYLSNLQNIYKTKKKKRYRNILENALSFIECFSNLNCHCHRLKNYNVSTNYEKHTKKKPPHKLKKARHILNKHYLSS